MLPQSTFGATEYIEFTAPAAEPEPAPLSLPASVNPADRFVYYRIMGR